VKKLDKKYDKEILKEKLYLGRFYEEWIKKLLFESTDLFYVLETVEIPIPIL
jgi:hypothetical protein